MGNPYLSEVKYLGAGSLDFVEVAVDAGTDVSTLTVTIYNPDGSVRSVNAINGLSHTTVAGKDVYTVSYGSPSSFNGLHKFGGVALSDSSSVYSFVTFSDKGTTMTATGGAADGLTSTDIGQAGAGQSLETTDGGATYSTQSTPNSGTIPCLTKGTRVRTDRGDVAVEDLTAGMRILTGDGRAEPLRKLLSRRVAAAEIAENERLAPVRITAGALGQNLPSRDLLVSRQHRMLAASPITRRMFGAEAVLIAAIRLTAMPGIYLDRSAGDVTYYHLLFDRHCIIFAENTPTESLFVDHMGDSNLPDDLLEEIYALFPQFRSEAYLPRPAALIPSRLRQKGLVRRHVKNAAPLLSGPANARVPSFMDRRFSVQ